MYIQQKYQNAHNQGTDAVLPSFSVYKVLEHWVTQYSSFNLTNTTYRIHRSSANTGQKNATGNSDKAKAEDTT